jgi:uncharacterized phage protein (TIGR02218 family)
VKSIPSALATHYAGNATSIVHFLLITRTDAQVFGFTSHDRDITISSQLYRSAPGLDVTSVVTSAGFDVDNLELTTIDDGSTFSRADVLSGRWKNAKFAIYKGNWTSISDGLEAVLAGTIGEATLKNTSLVFELRGLQQYLQQPVGDVSSKTCRAHFADFPNVNNNNRCRLVAATYTFTATVTSVTSNQVFTATALTQAADYFGEGVLTWTSGPNAGLRQKVRTHATGGVITLSLPMLLTVAVGNAFSIIAGCRKRLTEDCKTKFSNVVNFQGEPHRPTTDDLTQSPDANA